MAYDLVIRNGTIVDGSGAAPYAADVAHRRRSHRGDRRGRRARATTEIDAEGHIVTPGFVDGHTHLDAQIFWDPLGTPVSSHGVTTVVMGNCGFTLAPCRESEAYLALRSLERAEDMSAEVLAAGVPWQWETYREYLDVVDGLPKGINYAGYIGHSALRTYVMGERAFSEPATDDDLERMCREVDDALRAGAVGFTTSRSPNHETSDDRPVASRLADWSEVQRLAGVMGDLGAGVFELANEQHSTPEEFDEYFGRLRDLAVDTGRPVTFVVGFTKSDVARATGMMRALDDTAAAGARMVGQANPREFQGVLSFQTTLPFDRLPEWRELRARPLDDAGRGAARSRRARPPGRRGGSGRLRAGDRRRSATARLRLDPRVRRADPAVPHGRRGRGGARRRSGDRDDRSRARARSRPVLPPALRQRRPRHAARRCCRTRTRSWRPPTPARTCRRSPTRRSRRTSSRTGCASSRP